jgi:hypothetical protein
MAMLSETAMVLSSNGVPPRVLTADLLQESPLLPTRKPHILSERQPSVRPGSVLVAVLSVPVVSTGSSSKRRVV